MALYNNGIELFQFLKRGFKLAPELEQALSHNSDEILEAINKGKTDEWIEKAAKSTDPHLITLASTTGIKTFLETTSRRQRFVLDFIEQAKSGKNVDFTALSKTYGLDEASSVVKSAKNKLKALRESEVAAEAKRLSDMESRIGSTLAEDRKLAEDNIKLMNEHGISRADIEARARAIWEREGKIDDLGASTHRHQQTALAELVAEKKAAKEAVEKAALEKVAAEKAAADAIIAPEAERLSKMPGRGDPSMADANWKQAEENVKLMKDHGISQADIDARARAIWEKEGKIDDLGASTYRHQQQALSELAAEKVAAKAAPTPPPIPATAPPAPASPPPLTPSRIGASSAAPTPPTAAPPVIPHPAAPVTTAAREPVAHAGTSAPTENTGFGAWLAKKWFHGNLSGGGHGASVPATFGDTGVRLPKFQTEVDLQKFVLRRNWNPLKLFTNWAPLTAMATESRPIMRGVVHSVDTFMKETGLVDSLRGLDKEILDRAKAGHNGMWSFRKFALDPANQAKLKEFEAGMKELRKHVNDTYKTVDELQPSRSGNIGMVLDATPGFAKNGRTGVTAAQKADLLNYLDKMAEMAVELQKPNGKIADDVARSLAKIKDGSRTIADFENGFTGLSRAYSYATDAEMRLTGVIPGTDIPVAHQWNERLVRSLQNSAFNDEHLAEKIDIDLIKGKENIENTWQNQLLVFAERKVPKVKDADGSERFSWNSTLYDEFFSPLDTLYVNGHGQEANYTIRDLMARAQAWGKPEMQYIPSADAFEKHFKASSRYKEFVDDARTVRNPEFSPAYKKWADTLTNEVREDERARGGAPIAYFGAFESNRQNRHFYMSESYPMRMAERHAASNGATKLWMAKPGYNFVMDKYVKMPLARLGYFLRGAKETKVTQDLSKVELTLKQEPIWKAVDKEGKAIEGGGAVARRVALRLGSFGLINDISMQTLKKPWTIFTKLGWLGVGGGTYALATRDAHAETRTEAVLTNPAVRLATLPGRTVLSVVTYPFKDHETYTLESEVNFLAQEKSAIDLDTEKTEEEKKALKENIDTLTTYAEKLLANQKTAKKNFDDSVIKVESKVKEMNNTKGTEAQTAALKADLEKLQKEKNKFEAAQKLADKQVGDLTAKLVNRRKNLEEIVEVGKDLQENAALQTTALTDSERTKAKAEEVSLNARKKQLIIASVLPKVPASEEKKPDPASADKKDAKVETSPAAAAAAAEAAKNELIAANIILADAKKELEKATTDAQKQEAQDKITAAESAIKALEKKAETKPEDKKAGDKKDDKKTDEKPKESKESRMAKAMEGFKDVQDEIAIRGTAVGMTGNPLHDANTLLTKGGLAFTKAVKVQQTDAVTQTVDQVISVVHNTASKLITGATNAFNRARAPGNEEGHAWLGIGGGLVGGLAAAMAFSKLSESKWMGKIGAWPFIGPIVKMVAFGAFFMMFRKGTHSLLSQGSGNHIDHAVLNGAKPAPRVLTVEENPVVKAETIKKNLIDARLSLHNAEIGAKAAPGNADKAAQLEYAKRNLELATNRALAAGIDVKSIKETDKDEGKTDSTGGGGDTKGVEKKDVKKTEGDKKAAPGTTENVDEGKEIDPVTGEPIAFMAPSRNQSHEGTLPVVRGVGVDVIRTDRALASNGIIAGLKESMEEARIAAAQGGGKFLPRDEFDRVSLSMMGHTRGSDSMDVLFGKDVKGPTPGNDFKNPEIVLTA